MCTDETTGRTRVRPSTVYQKFTGLTAGFDLGRNQAHFIDA